VIRAALRRALPAQRARIDGAIRHDSSFYEARTATVAPVASNFRRRRTSGSTMNVNPLSRNTGA